MGRQEHTPFQRGGNTAPVRYTAVAPVDVIRFSEPPAAPTAPPPRLVIGIGALLLVVLVLAGQLLLRSADTVEGGPLPIAGLDGPPTTTLRDAADAFLPVLDADITADARQADRSRVGVRSTDRATGQRRCERDVDFGEPIGSIRLVDTHADDTVVLALTAEPSQRVVSRTAERVVVEMFLPPTTTLVALDLASGEEHGRVDWTSRQTPVASDDGHLYRWDRDAGEFAAFAGLDTMLWSSPVTLPAGAEFRARRHGQWLLVVPGDEDLRARHRGSDVFLAALDPATGAPAEWMSDEKSQHLQRLVLDDRFVEYELGVWTREVRARSWDDGEVLWRRYHHGGFPMAVDGRLYVATSSDLGTTLASLDVGAGHRVWSMPLDGTPALLLADREQLLVALREDRTLEVLDPAEGHRLRTLDYAPDDGAQAGTEDGAGLPFLGEGKYFVPDGAHTGLLTLSARSLDDGRLLWASEHAGFDTVARMGDRLVLVGESGEAPLDDTP